MNDGEEKQVINTESPEGAKENTENQDVNIEVNAQSKIKQRVEEKLKKDKERVELRKKNQNPNKSFDMSKFQFNSIQWILKELNLRLFKKSRKSSTK